MGEARARTIRIPRQTRKSGVRIFPIQVRIWPGFREKNSTAPKNTRENAVSHRVELPRGSSCSIPTV